MSARGPGAAVRGCPGRPATCCWWITSAPRTAGSHTRDRARSWPGWPTRSAGPTSPPGRRD